jgi:hypothetical protein
MHAREICGKEKSLATIQAQELGVFLGRAIINPGQI